MPLTLAESGTTAMPLLVIGAYFGLLLLLGALSGRFFRGTSADYFVASRSIGPFMLLMSVFGTTMTAFALVGSTGKSFDIGIGVYGMLASWSGLMHSAVFFLVGMKLWAVGKRYGYMTQVQYFRDRFASNALGYVLFPILVALVIPYLLIGLLGAGSLIRGMSEGMFPDAFPATDGAVPPWLTALIVSCVVLCYVFFSGVRGAIWANTFQTLVFMTTGVVAFFMISRALGGAGEAASMVLERSPDHLTRQRIGQWQFLTYLFIPLSVGMFPHVFQHWLTARSARTFRLTIIAHPLFIMIVWVPTVLIGVWAAGLAAGGELSPPSSNAVLGAMVGELVQSPLLMGLLLAGILAAIMSSLDSQFVCLGTMFTNDVVIRAAGRDRFTDRQKVWISRCFVVAIVAITYLVSLTEPGHIFDLGVWCFSGFAALFPLAFAAVYWRRVTTAGAFACIITTAIVWSVFFIDDIVLPGTAILGSETPYGDYLVLGVVPAAFIFAASVIALVGVSLLTRPLPAATIDKFFPPRDEPAAQPAPADQPEPARTV